MAMPVAAAGVPRKPWYRVLYVQVLIAVLIGILLGHFAPSLGEQMQPLATAFINLVKMIIAPVIFCTVVTGIGGVQSLEKTGRVGVKALAYFLFFSTLALIVGLIIANVVQPGAGLHANIASLNAKDVATVQGYATKAHEQTVMAFLMNIIPTTVVGAFASGDILQVLFFSVLFGVGLALMGERGRPLTNMIGLVSGAIFGVVHIVMKVAPLGAFGGMAYTIGKFGLGALVSLGWLIGTFYLTSLIFVLGVLGVVCRLNGFSILRLIRYIKDELLLVLGTSSSESALPAVMEKLERAGCARPVVGLVVPTGYSFNLDGTNIYMTMAALFIAQATDTPLSIGDQIVLLLVAMLSSKGAAGITGSGFITLAATLSVLPSVPLAGMAIILGVDRFMSECRSLTNFVGNAVACIVVANWEGELDKERLHEALDLGTIPTPEDEPLRQAAVEAPGVREAAE
jgi:aerobic C4-dicarboxylate transport protein